LSSASAPKAPAAPKKPQHRLLGVLRILLAVVLLGAVAYFVPWRDRLTYADAGATLSVAGDIEGNWRDASVRFHVDPKEELAAGWPARVAAAQKSGTALEVVRAVEDAAPNPDPARERFDWRPGMLRVFRELDPKGLWIALAMILWGSIVAITRWWRLLSIAGCPTTFSNVFRLTFLGFFFNLIVPGLTGGDVIKAILVVREHPERRADALMSVIVDRGLGLIVLMGLASGVTLIPGSRFHELRIPVILSFLGVLFGLWLVLHPWPRRILKIESILARLPQAERIRSLDRALRLYGSHPFEMLIAVCLSIVNHSSIAFGLFELGRAFGDLKLTYFEYLGVASIANTISSVPIAPGGWGVGEAAYASLFHLLGAAATLGIAVSVTYRLLTMVMSLFGGLFLLLPSGKNVRSDIDASA
jgi:glycosyltransferase 2 family protein